MPLGALGKSRRTSDRRRYSGLREKSSFLLLGGGSLLVGTCMPLFPLVLGKGRNLKVTVSIHRPYETVISINLRDIEVGRELDL